MLRLLAAGIQGASFFQGLAPALPASVTAPCNALALGCWAAVPHSAGKVSPDQELLILVLTTCM